MGQGMKQDCIDYFRDRERAEREAVGNASCEEARWAHEQMADAYARLVDLEELKAAGAIAPDKVVTLADAMRARDDARYGRRAVPLRNAPPAPARHS